MYRSRKEQYIMENNILDILCEICFLAPEGYYERKEVKYY
jgi:hypothetical protein